MPSWNLCNQYHTVTDSICHSTRLFRHQLPPGFTVSGAQCLTVSEKGEQNTPIWRPKMSGVQLKITNRMAIHFTLATTPPWLSNWMLKIQPPRKKKIKYYFQNRLYWLKKQNKQKNKTYIYTSCVRRTHQRAHQSTMQLKTVCSNVASDWPL